MAFVCAFDERKMLTIVMGRNPKDWKGGGKK